MATIEPLSKTDQDKTAKPPSSATEQSLAVQKIFIKGSLFEAVTLTPELLKNMPNPIIDLQAQTNYTERSEKNYEAVLTLTLTAKVEGNLLWRVQLQQAGIYILKGFNEEQSTQILYGYCMNQLYPYACAAVSTMVVQGGFLPAHLAPMDFDMLYREQKKQAMSATKN